MDNQERSAKKYLDGLSIGEVIFEPDGNNPPDFSVASTIAVEVRRLNQIYSHSGETAGLEEVDVPLHMKLRKVLSSYDSQYTGTSFWVDLDFRRPLLGGIKEVGLAIQNAMNGFLKGPRSTPCQLDVDPNITLSIRHSDPVVNRLFRYASTIDQDWGGTDSDVQIYSKNISRFIHLKSQSIALYKARYGEWWLLLVDTIMAWGFDAEEVRQVRSQIPGLGSFDKLIVLDYHGEKRLLQVP